MKVEDFGATPTAALIEIMRRLREPDGGCPWDIEQTFETIAPYTIEEAYEVADAIAHGSRDELRGELGDLLLQVVYHAQMATEEGSFAFDDVAHEVADKMLRRHPHVFGDEVVATADAQVSAWEATKAAERKAKGEGSALDGVARALPALMRAQKLKRRAARVGFDWPDAGAVIEKVVEEAQEIVEARDEGQARVNEEFGDLLFVVAVLGDHLGVDAEEALRAANTKFERRFKGMEKLAADAGGALNGKSLEELDALWDAMKALEKVGE